LSALHAGMGGAHRIKDQRPQPRRALMLLFCALHRSRPSPHSESLRPTRPTSQRLGPGPASPSARKPWDPVCHCGTSFRHQPKSVSWIRNFAVSDCFDAGFRTRSVHAMGDDPRAAGSVPSQCECLAFPVTTGCQLPFLGSTAGDINSQTQP